MELSGKLDNGGEEEGFSTDGMTKTLGTGQVDVVTCSLDQHSMQHSYE